MVGLHSIGDGRIHIEAAMQRLHDNGKWTWYTNRLIDDYYNVPEPKGTKGLQYVFKTNH